LTDIDAAKLDWLATADRTLLLLLLRLFPSTLGCFVMTNHTASAGSEEAMMAGKVTSHTPDNGAL
jgi:hypothetical protein